MQHLEILAVLWSCERWSETPKTDFLVPRPIYNSDGLKSAAIAEFIPYLKCLIGLKIEYSITQCTRDDVYKEY